MRQYAWNDWVDFMEDNHQIRIPNTIEFRTGDNKNDLTTRETPEATLDELATAIVNLEEEIARLNALKDALMALEVRVRSRVRPGTMKVLEALFADGEGQEMELSDDLESRRNM